MGHVARATRSHGLDYVEVGERHDQGEQYCDRDYVAHHRQRNVDEALPGIGAVDRRRLIELLWHRFERSEIHDQEKRRAVPDINENHGKSCPIWVAEPWNFTAPKQFNQPNERSVSGIEQPPPAKRRQREWDDPRYKQHSAPFALSLDGQIVDQMRRDEPDQR